MKTKAGNEQLKDSLRELSFYVFSTYAVILQLYHYEEGLIEASWNDCGEFLFFLRTEGQKNHLT